MLVVMAVSMTVVVVVAIVVVVRILVVVVAVVVVAVAFLAVVVAPTWRCSGAAAPWCWRSSHESGGRWLAATVNEDLATVAGLRPERTRLIFGLLMATVIAVAIKIVGILLIVALLVIPAATARRCAVNPEQMAALAGAAGVLSIAGGLFASARLDTPSGPSIVVAGLLLFAVTRFRRSSQRTRS